MTEIYGVTYVNYSAQFVANEAGVTSNIARILCRLVYRISAYRLFMIRVSLLSAQMFLVRQNKGRRLKVLKALPNFL